MKNKPKIDPKKIIKVKPRMVKEGTFDLNLMFMVIIGLILIIFLISCGEEKKTNQSPQQPLELSKDPNTENYYQKVTEYTYEGCEYIKVGYGKSVWGSHKGNCENPIHKGQHPNPYTFDISEEVLDVDDTTNIKID